MLHSALCVQREPFCVPSLNVWICVWDVVSYMHDLLFMTSSSFNVGSEPLPDDVACALETSVVAMTKLIRLVMHDLPLPVVKSLPKRTEPLDDLYVFTPPGVNWVSGNVFCQCAHNTTISS